MNQTTLFTKIETETKKIQSSLKYIDFSGLGIG